MCCVCILRGMCACAAALGASESEIVSGVSVLFAVCVCVGGW